MPDRETIALYSDRAADYATCVAREDDDGSLTAFMARLPAGGRVLDLGCGPGRAAARMARAGFTVEALDAAPGMVALAARQAGVSARLGTFDDIVADPPYAGIWANFSLLHAPRADMPRHLARIHAALQPGGQFHIGLKCGEGTRRDAIGRLYTYYTVAEISGLLDAAGFTILDRETGESAGFSGEVSPWVTLAATRP